MRSLLTDPEVSAFVDERLQARGLPSAGVILRALGNQPGRIGDCLTALYGVLVKDGLYERFPDLWVLDKLGEYPYGAQRRILRKVATSRRTAVVASFGIGKDWTIARIVAQWVSEAENAEDIYVVTTAPSFIQVRAILWKEIRSAWRKGNLRGQVNQTEWLIDKDLVAFGRKPADHDTTGFQGIHAKKRVLVIGDEAAGLPALLIKDMEKLVTTPESRIVLIGNPDFEGSFWHEICTNPRLGYETLWLSAFDTPAFTGEEVPPDVLQAVTSKLWVKEQGERYGENSPEYTVLVLGKFPKDKQTTTIPISWIRQCISPPTRSSHEGTRQLGVDIAAGGKDKTVIWLRIGRALFQMWTLDTNSSVEIVDTIVSIAHEHDVGLIVIDSIGVGFGIVEPVRNRVGAKVHSLNVAESSNIKQEAVPNPDRGKPDIVKPMFANLRAELWWMGRENTMKSLNPSYRGVVPYSAPWDLSAAEYDMLSGEPVTHEDWTIVDLSTPTYSFRQTDRAILIESADDLRKPGRLGRSPDFGTAALMAFYRPSAEPMPVIEYGGSDLLPATTQETGVTPADILRRRR